jgi:hypothetical protein
MSKFLNTTTQTIVWLKKTNENGELQMKPPFQRNPVWTHPQKSYLIDSILNGFPIPEIYMQQYVDESGNEKHIIIDGQQRVRSCLEFVEGNFEIKADESPTWGGMKFDDLSPEDKKKIFGYKFIVRQLPEMSDEDIRGVFQRLNKNVVALNSQELRQATYWGPFIRTMQEIANYGYWSTTGIFSPLNTRRMMDIEYISEISIALLHGHQNKKESLDEFYRIYEEEFDSRDELIEKFQKTIFELEHLYPDLKNNRWRKKSDFYSLFVLFASKSDLLPLSNESRKEARLLLDNFANQINGAIGNTQKLHLTAGEQNYVHSIRASSDIGNRKRRHEALEDLLQAIFQPEMRKELNALIAPLKDGLFDKGEEEE